MAESKNLFGGSSQQKFAPATGGSFAGVKLGELKPAPATTTPNLFGQASGSVPMFKPISGGTFGGVKLPTSEAKPEDKPSNTTTQQEAQNKDGDKKDEAKKPATLFGQNAAGATGTSGSLFGNLNTIKQTEADPAKKNSLFGNPIPAPAGGQKFGLFGQKPADSTDAAAKPATSGLFGSGPAKPATSLFGAPPASGGLFGNAPPASGSLFGAPAAAGSGSLFGNANAGSTLFKFGDNKVTKADNAAGNKSDDDDGDEEEGEKSPPIYADSTTKVEFKGAGAQAIQPSPYTKLFEVSLICHFTSLRIIKAFSF